MSPLDSRKAGKLELAPLGSCEDFKCQQWAYVKIRNVSTLAHVKMGNVSTWLMWRWEMSPLGSCGDGKCLHLAHVEMRHVST